jgi:hypothetical protein
MAHRYTDYQAKHCSIKRRTTDNSLPISQILVVIFIVIHTPSITDTHTHKHTYSRTPHRVHHKKRPHGHPRSHHPPPSHRHCSSSRGVAISHRSDKHGTDSRGWTASESNGSLNGAREEAYPVWRLKRVENVQLRQSHHRIHRTA